MRACQDCGRTVMTCICETPKPEAPIMKCAECGSAHYGGAFCKPAKDAGATFDWQDRCEKLERENESLCESFDEMQKLAHTSYSRGIQEGLTQERTRAAALVEALEMIQNYATKVTLTESEWDFIVGKLVREALAKWGKG